MPRVHIVTDSCAHFASPHYARQHAITIVPNKLSIGGKIYREGVDLSAEEALQLITRQKIAPTVTAPSAVEYADVYTRLASSSDAIISIHASREIFSSWHHARAAAEQVAGKCEVIVIDSQTLCAAQGMLVRETVRAIEQEAVLDDIVRRVRGAIDRLYSVYYVENIDFLQQNKILSVSHAILGTMLGIKPFLTVEEGHLVPIEKVRTRAQAVERMVEFTIEFTDVDDVLIVQHKPHLSEQARMLQERLSAEFPNRHFPHTVYAPSLAALIGPDATGVVILESKMETLDDGF